MLSGQRPLAQREPGAPNGRFDAGGDDKWQRALVVDRNPRVLDAEFIEHGARLLQNRIAIIGSNSRFKRDFHPAAVAYFEGDVNVGADVLAAVTGFGGTRGGFNCAAHTSLYHRGRRGTARSWLPLCSSALAAVILISAFPKLRLSSGPSKRRPDCCLSIR